MTKAEKQTLVMFAASLRDKIRHEEEQEAAYKTCNQALSFQHTRQKWSLQEMEEFCRDMAAGLR